MSSSKVFSATGAGPAFSVPHGETLDYATILDGEGVTFDGTFVLQRSNDGFLSSETVVTKSAASSGSVVCEHPGRTSYSYRWYCTSFGESGDPVLATIDEATTDARTLDEVATITEERIRATVDIRTTGVFSAGGTANDDSVTVLLRGPADNVVLGVCATANIPTGSGYRKGCLLMISDASDNTDVWMVNIGNATTANFNAVTIAADA